MVDFTTSISVSKAIPILITFIWIRSSMIMVVNKGYVLQGAITTKSSVIMINLFSLENGSRECIRHIKYFKLVSSRWCISHENNRYPLPTFIISFSRIDYSIKWYSMTSLLTFYVSFSKTFLCWIFFIQVEIKYQVLLSQYFWFEEIWLQT